MCTEILYSNFASTFVSNWVFNETQKLEKTGPQRGKGGMPTCQKILQNSKNHLRTLSCQQQYDLLRHNHNRSVFIHVDKNIFIQILLDCFLK